MAAAAPAVAQASLGIELGSTRIKACLVDPGGALLATGQHEWENEYVDGVWTYSMAAVWAGIQDCVRSVLDDVEARQGVRPATVASIGISAMMHGYLALDAAGNALVPFRTWRNTSTGAAAAALTDAFGCNIPLRWSVAHVYQAVLDGEPHLGEVHGLTTLAGYVHRSLSGRSVLGVGDASGMFPIDPATGTYDVRLLARFDELAGGRLPAPLVDLLPEVLRAGAEAGRLTADGALLLDPSGRLAPGIPLCPPEGDAGTGMVATNAIAPRTGNVSVGTSIFAMVVLERPLTRVHTEVDVVTTPDGDPVAMVHCNNGASELAAWADVFTRFAEVSGASADRDAVFAALLTEALAAEPDAGGLLAYNYVAGEPITDVAVGRPLLVRGPDSRLTLANLMRAHVFAAFATLSLGMETLKEEGVAVDVLLAHGGVFRTAGVAQRLLAASVGAPVAVLHTAGEGGAWGMALLAAYSGRDGDLSLADFLSREVFAGTTIDVVDPDPTDVAGFAEFLTRFVEGLPMERAAGSLRGWMD